MNTRLVFIFLFTYRYSNTNYCAGDSSYEIFVILETTKPSRRIHHSREVMPVYPGYLRVKNRLCHIPATKKRVTHSRTTAT